MIADDERNATTSGFEPLDPGLGPTERRVVDRDKGDSEWLQKHGVVEERGEWACGHALIRETLVDGRIARGGYRAAVVEELLAFPQPRHDRGAKEFEVVPPPRKAADPTDEIARREQRPETTVDVVAHELHGWTPVRQFVGQEPRGDRDQRGGCHRFAVVLAVRRRVVLGSSSPQGNVRLGELPVVVVDLVDDDLPRLAGTQNSFSRTFAHPSLDDDDVPIGQPLTLGVLDHQSSVRTLSQISGELDVPAVLVEFRCREGKPPVVRAAKGDLGTDTPFSGEHADLRRVPALPFRERGRLRCSHTWPTRGKRLEDSRSWCLYLGSAEPPSPLTCYP